MQENFDAARESIRNGWIHRLKDLVEGEPSLLHEHARGWTLLHEAVRSRCVASARYLLASGAKASPPASSLVRSPLTFATGNGDVEMMEAILGYTGVGQESATLVVNASCIDDDSRPLEMLLKHGFDPNAVASQGTALTQACANGNEEHIRILMEAGADPTLACNGYTPAEVAYEHRWHDVAALMQAHEAAWLIKQVQAGNVPVLPL